MKKTTLIIKDRGHAFDICLILLRTFNIVVVPQTYNRAPGFYFIEIPGNIACFIFQLQQAPLFIYLLKIH